MACLRYLIAFMVMQIHKLYLFLLFFFIPLSLVIVSCVIDKMLKLVSLFPALT
jgi:hypothetical protein